MYAYPIQSAYWRTEDKELLARLVVPELQQHGLYRKDSTGVIHRDHLSLARSALGARRTLLDATHSLQGCALGCSSVRHAF
jgi:hypothetical protein